jgi:hypothetical protein
MSERLPVYGSVAAACKVGCFCCGATLDPAKATCQTARRPVRFTVVCDACGDPTTFIVHDRIQHPRVK